MEMPNPQIPLSVEGPKQAPMQTPFQMAGQALELESALGKRKEQQEQDADNKWLKQYLAEGGNVDTPEGIEKATSDSRGKVSANMTMSLNQAHQNSEKVKTESILALSKVGPEKLKFETDKLTFIDQQLTDSLDIYTQEGKEKGSQAALQAWDASKQKIKERAAGMKNPDGTPMFPQEALNRIDTMTPAQAASLKTTVNHRQELAEQAIEMRTKRAQAEELEARAQAEREGRRKGTIGPGGERPPAGYRYNAQGNLEFIPGGPADPENKKAKFGSREQIVFSRLATGATEAVKDVENITRLPMSATTGAFGGMAGGQPSSIYEAGRNALLNKLTPQEVQSYKVRSAGIQRSLSAIEASGLMPPGTLTHQMDAVLWTPEDTQLTKLQKLAQTRQIVEAGMEVQLANPAVPDKERKQVEETLARLQKAIPYTIEDLDELEAAQKKNPKATLKSILDKKKKAEQPEAAPAPVQTPVAPKKAESANLSAQDKKAVDWAKAHPNDPRAKDILKLHGM